ncbi:hypothetical protein K402DRAFT_30780 [Aulographum hederae CBS 113979]|uniref:Uncharacterized protein n=1 Tax=Aulographum hederae CBS 113979 TaxID=1176131 RepID=A0A6G1H4P0_9PEZI|nr:hypothetical protein K402DRAFT_30780 [Aulographum hederae CBS 113979]
MVGKYVIYLFTQQPDADMPLGGVHPHLVPRNVPTGWSKEAIFALIAIVLFILAWITYKRMKRNLSAVWKKAVSILGKNWQSCFSADDGMYTDILNQQQNTQDLTQDRKRSRI